MENHKKCSCKEHLEYDSISYCQKCEIYMCNKCQDIHSNLCPNHQQFIIKNLDNDIQEIFTGLCKEKNHPNILDYFCKTHNKLCCANCLCKINGKGNGIHKDCDVCFIEDIKNKKKTKLKENINSLKEFSNTFEKSIEELKNICDDIEKKKEELKTKITKIFTNIRNTLNEREDELLLEVDNKFNKLFVNEDILKKGEKIPNKIKISLDKGTKIDNNWDDKILKELINECIIIENNIKDINEINEEIKKCKSNSDLDIYFEPEEGNKINNLLDNIKSFGNVNSYNSNIFTFKECPKNIIENRKYIISGAQNNIITNYDDYWIGAICKNRLKMQKIYKWKIKILKTINKDIMVGVAPYDFDINKSLYKYGWYINCNDSTLYSGLPHNYRYESTNLSKIESEITIILNIKEQTLKFIINNEDKGNSYINIPLEKPLTPAVILVEKNDSVEIQSII